MEEICENCYYAREHFNVGFVECRRYPRTIDVAKERWCGEYKEEEDGRE